MVGAYAVETRELARTFKKRTWGRRNKEEPAEVVALDHVNLTIGQGELFGLLGPNGAGKTTLIKILATLLLPTSGQAYVAGHDVDKDPFPIRQVINMVSGGESSGYGLLRVRENLWMFSQFYGIPSRVAKERIDELLKTFGLWEKRDAKVNTLSSGMRQKMNMVRGLMTGPTILFLDEPTLGLDVNASRIIRDYVKGWVAERKERTVLLTTHYMAEADYLCDRVAIIDKGRILACDTPERLKATVKQDLVYKLEVDLLKDPASLQRIPAVRNLSWKNDGATNTTSLTLILNDEAAVADLLGEISASGSKVHVLRKTEPTLEDVFVSLVGRSLE